MNEELKKACELLRYFNEWRRGGDGEMPNPTEIGKALDLVLEYVENQISGQIGGQIKLPSNKNMLNINE